MKSLFYLFTISIGVLFISGCTVYTPQTTSIPLMSQKGEIQVDGGLTFFSGATGTITYSPITRLSLQAFGSAIGDHWHFQGAVGTYLPVKKFQFELFAGYGAGEGSGFNNAIPSSITGNYQHFFTQVNFGQRSIWDGRINYGIGIKAVGLRSSVKNEGYYEWSNSTAPTYFNDRNISIEPNIFFRIGGKKLKFSLQGNRSIFTQITNKQNNFSNAPFNISLGLNYTIMTTRK